MVIVVRVCLTSSVLFSLAAWCCGQVEHDPRDFQNIGLSGGGVITNIAVSPIDHNALMLATNMGGVFVTYDGPKQWKMVHHAQLGYSRDCRGCFHPKDPNVIYAPSGGKLRVSRDRGRTWKPLGDLGRLEREIAIHPEHTDLMLAGSDRSVWRSSDGGSHWVRVEGPAGSVIGLHFDLTSGDEREICFAATSEGVWRSDDGGEAWSKKVNGLPSGAVNAFAAGSNRQQATAILYCAVRDVVYRSTDRGETWLSLPTEFRMRSGFLLAADADPRTVYAVTSGSSVFRSGNAGESWTSILHTRVAEPGFNLEHNYFTAYIGRNSGEKLYWAAIAPGNPDFVIVGTGMMCLYTTDGGGKWHNAHTIPVTGPGEDQPRTFLNTGLNVTTTWHYYVDPFEPSRHYIAYTDIGFSRSEDGGGSWLFWPYWGPDRSLPFLWHNTCYEIAFDPETPGKMWAAFSRAHDIPNSNAIVRDHVTALSDDEKQGGIAFSDNFAADWQYEDWNEGLPGRPVISLIIDPSSPRGRRTLYAAVYEEGVYKSTDDGHTWSKKSEGLGSDSNRHVTRVQLHKDGTLFCLITAVRGFSADGVGLYRSRDGGESWELVNQGQIFLWPKDFAVHPDDSSIVYVGANSAGAELGGLWRTTDGGRSWTALAKKGDHFGAYFHPTRPGWIYMSLCEGGRDESGLWLSRDNGSSWEPYEKIPHKWIQRVDFDPGNDDVMYVSTFGASVYRVPADPRKQLEPAESERAGSP